MKLSIFGVITLLLFGIVIALTGIVCADQVVPAVPETQTLSTVTTEEVDGLVMETDAGAWSVTSGGIPISGDDPILMNYPGWADSSWGSYEDFLYMSWDGYEVFVDPNPANLVDMLNYYITTDLSGRAADASALKKWLANQGSLSTTSLKAEEIRYTTAYDANIVAQAGHTSFVKSMNIDTRNKVIGRSNLDAKTALTYIATADGGNVVGSENLMLDGAGQTTSASDRMLCPFASQPVDIIPAYCNIVQAGSKYDLTIGSVTTNANDRFVGTDATNPVVLNYDINVKPYTASGAQVPATGSAMAYMKAHIQESRGYNSTTIPYVLGPVIITFSPDKAEDLTYSETSSANGYITSFNKEIHYQSGKSLL